MLVAVAAALVAMRDDKARKEREEAVLDVVVVGVTVHVGAVVAAVVIHE